MLKPATVLADFVLERIDAEPLGRRVTITRALAAVTVNQAQRAELLAMANELEAIQHRHNQLLLNFRGGRKS